jgi:hypothetical protein
MFRTVVEVWIRSWGKGAETRQLDTRNCWRHCGGLGKVDGPSSIQVCSSRSGTS